MKKLLIAVLPNAHRLCRSRPLVGPETMYP